ncbi:tRNA (adenosine(37)-N6)-dimethylallyltransferase MiaA [Natribacillus halophilus]|uniref:tRNA dimethylallyltransferase n=1 Tax=Natribacillus halophilus TaxID=549003 RepID=A0A1G8PUR0_9BACI|nr:tRNA (adenosine(37)-N6)-dimethylallyltransferase MiaA [Natribacillus halophilus]SDI95610.1 tRNA dimethylallyltransferase [Natribacillus halophilus]
MEKKPLIVIVGPTAVGKTHAGIEVAKTFAGEIINGDAFQVYRGLDIGTAKASTEEQDGVPHHLIDILAPTDTYSAAQFRRDAIQKIDEIDGRGHVPVIVGGTGMYIKGITSDWSFNDVAGDEQFRKRLEARGEEEVGAQKLHEELALHDPDAAKRIHPRNVRKIIRALELIYAGKPAPAPVTRDDGQPGSHQVLMIGLTMERATLYERIEARVEHMLAEGLLSEVSALYEAGIRHTQAMKGIGYKELVAYLDGDCSFEEAVTQLKRNSRRFAKRQLTWFRNKENVTWFEVREGEEKKLIDKICTHLAGKWANTSKDY